MKPSLPVLFAVLASVACATSFSQAAFFDQPVYHPIVGAAAEAMPARDLHSRAELEAFIDGVLAVQFKKDHIAGATVAVVKDGKLFFAKGYGYEDVDKLVPVDPDRSLFRAGSISKLFTWTAVMQLVERGQLDLDQDVNLYLRDFKIPATFTHPVTLRNLMTHTPGFEDGGIGYLFSRHQEDLLPLGAWLERHLPARVRPPTTDFDTGSGASYSNWGAALAGHIVATVSGMSFDDYVERNIFQPLGMAHSTFREPLPQELSAHLSPSYGFADGFFENRGFEFVHSAGPAGSLSTTATDMAKFALAHLQDGAVGDAHILKPETALLMHRRALSLDPAMNGVTLGFVENWVNGRRTIGHNGDTVYFHSDLTLVPEAQLALFSSYNSDTAGSAPGELAHAFLQRYFPGQLPEIKPRADANVRNAHYAGSYRLLRRSYTKVEKAFVALVGDINVKALPDGTLSIFNPIDRLPARWVEVGDGVFRKTDDELYVAFKGDRDGHATNFIGSFPPPVTAERIAGYERTSFHALLIAVSLALFISTLVTAFRRLRARDLGAGLLKWAWPTLAVAAALYIGFLVGIVVVISGGIEALIFAYPPSFYLALTLPLLAIPPTVCAVVCVFSLWWRRAWSTGARLHYTVATLAALVFLWVLNYWNLLGYRFG